MNRETQTVYRYAWAILAIFVCVVLLFQVFGIRTQAVMSFARARKEIGETRNEMGTVRKAHAKLEAIALQKDADMDRLRASVARSQQDVADEKARARRMEDPLAKIRQALGDIRMREILGESPA